MQRPRRAHADLAPNTSTAGATAAATSTRRPRRAPGRFGRARACGRGLGLGLGVGLEAAKVDVSIGPRELACLHVDGGTQHELGLRGVRRARLELA